MSRYFLALGLALWSALVARADVVEPAAWEPVAAKYAAESRGLLTHYCERCHRGEEAEAEVDLAHFTDFARVRQAPRVWQKVLEMLESRQMPPKDAKQPTEAERAALVAWVRGYLKLEARAQAGDPGRVVLRRLSNAEYTYTLCDLTGIDSLQPAREFPVDGAAGEGFSNAGEALAMSPALFSKYLDAGRGVAQHAVLLPDGLRFAQQVTRPDWTNEALDQIRALYGKYSDSSSSTKVKLQGLVWDTRQGGRLPLEKYLEATLVLRESPAPSIEAVARQFALSPRYLGLLWDGLNRKEPSLWLDVVRERWRSARRQDAAALAVELSRWQNAVWKFNSVGHVGKVGGPKAWMEPVEMLPARQEARLKIPAVVAGEVSLWFVAKEVGAAGKDDIVVWERPRFVTAGRPDVLLKDICVKGGGIDAGSFGRHPDGQGEVEASNLCLRAPHVVEVRVPAEAVAGCEFVVAGALHPTARAECSVQLHVLSAKPGVAPAFRPELPIVAGPAARTRLAAALEEFRTLLPPAVCYTRIVPVDEVVTLTLFYREDQHLARLMLDDGERRRLDKLWDELEYISQSPLTQVDAFTQLLEYASQDSNPKLFEPLRKPILERAAAFRKRLVETQPSHVQAVLDFAGRAYRRPLRDDEKDELRGLYQKLRQQELPHDEAIRLVLARVLVAPAFLYRLESPVAGTSQGPVSDWELASRLSYFLWSSAPDAELSQLAAAGKLSQPDVLAAQLRRMLQDGRVRRLAVEFACQWLHIRGFDEQNEKSERHFPTFAGIKGAMYEESILFFTDFFQRDRSVLDILAADHTFVNDALARHYGIDGIKGNDWRRIDGVRKLGRGGILGQATTLSAQSGASRTSPILRGNWVSEVLLGEKLPRPPKGVPQLPDDETKTEGLTVRQLVERHSSDAKCAVCHQRIDAYGFALEGFDAIGRRRDKDLADRPIDTRVKTMDGAELDGLSGLRDYLLNRRRDAFVRQFCRKLLGYALGRGVQLSDEPLLDDMQEHLKSSGYRITVALDDIVRSRQFREIRGKDHPIGE